jgi:lysozyme
MSPLEQSVELIKQFEGLSLSPYLDSANIPTIGYGNTYYQNHARVTMDDAPLTQEQADALINYYVDACLSNVRRMLNVDVNDNQLAALTSFQYNTGALAHSKLLVLLNNGDEAGAADQFSLWIHAGGKVIEGLVKRRAKERALFLGEV